jgi:hypothetical protein
MWFQQAVGGAILFAFGRRALRGLRMPRFGQHRGHHDPAPSTSPAQGAGS